MQIFKSGERIKEIACWKKYKQSLLLASQSTVGLKMERPFAKRSVVTAMRHPLRKSRTFHL